MSVILYFNKDSFLIQDSFLWRAGGYSGGQDGTSVG